MVDFIDRYLFRALILLGLLLLAGVLASFFASLPPREFVILTGREGGGNYQAALAYQEIARERDFEIEIRPTAGSVDVLQGLMNGEAEVGFVQGGIARDADTRLLASLATVYYEPVWVFYRRDSFGEEGPQYLWQLTGKRIGIGEKGSGTQALATQLLAVNGVSEGNAALVPAGATETAAALFAGDLDVAFLVNSEESTAVRQLLRTPGIELMDFERAEAYTAQFPFLKVVRLPQGAIDLQRNLPHEDKQLIATTANLVVRRDIHPDLLRLLTIAAVETHWDGGLFGGTGEFPNSDNADLPLDRHERAYLERIKSGQSLLDNYLPFKVAAIVDRYWLFVLPFVFLLVPLLVRVPLVYTIWNRYKVNRWYKVVREVELKLDQMDVYQLRQERARLQALDDRLTAQTHVGTFYLPATYDLHIHVEYVIRKLERREQMLLAEVGEGGQAGGGGDSR